MTPAARSRAIVAVCTAIYLLDGLIHTILGPLAPAFAPALALDNAALGPIFSANLVGQCIGLVVFPAIAGRFGHRVTVTLAVLGFALGQAASAFAHSGTALLALRLVTGVFLGGCLPSCLAIVTAQAPPARRGLAILTLFTGYGLGAALAGLVAAGFTELGGWRAAMAAVGLASLAAAAAAWTWLPQLPGPERSAERTPTPLALLDRSHRLGTAMLWLLFVLMLTISYCLNSWLPVMLVDAGFEPAFAALSVTVFGFGGALAALGVGLMIDRFGAIPVLIGALAAAAALLFAAGQALDPAAPGLLMALLGAAGFFSLGAYGGINVVLAAFYDDALRATGIGWAKSIGRLGTVVAPVLIGLALSAGVPADLVISLFAAPAILALAALVAIARTGRWRERAEAGFEPPTAGSVAAEGEARHGA